MSLRVPTVLLVACSVLFVACTAEPDDPDPAPGPLEATASIPIEGGVIELPDGARVEFPAGALAEGAEVTLRRFDCGGIYQAASFGSCRYAVEGPAQLLAGSYQLRLPTRAPACASQQTSDGLACIVGGASQSDSVTTAVGSFGEFTSWTADGIAPTDACVMPSFDGCGGDLTGSWSLTAGCGTIEQLTNISWTGPNPYESCDPLDYYRGYPFSISGGLEFSDGGYTLSSGFSIKEHELITVECLASIGQDCHPDCSLVDGVCECLFPKTDGEGASGDDVWSLGDPGIVILGGQQHRYCIEGDTLTVEWGAEGERYYLVYARE